MHLQDELYKQQDHTPAKPEEVAEPEEPDPLSELKSAIEAARKKGQEAIGDYETAFPEFQTVEHVETAPEKEPSEEKREDDAPDVLVGSQSWLAPE